MWAAYVRRVLVYKVGCIMCMRFARVFCVLFLFNQESGGPVSLMAGSGVA